MGFSYRDYCQYLVSSQKNYTLTYLAEHLEGVSHDRINRYLKNQPFPLEEFWKSVEKEMEIDEEGILIYDDTVLNKYSSKEIEIARYQYSGAKKKVLQGIGLVGCIYLNPKTGKYWLIDYRIYNPDEDGKTKLDHLIDMLEAAIFKKKLPIKAVLMDSWYASKKVMSVIDNWEKIYYCPLKRNRLVDDTGGQEKYKRVDSLKWNSQQEEEGKVIKIRGFPAEKKVKLFRVTISTNRTEYIATNDLSQNSTSRVKTYCAWRWKIEEFHREVKQVTGIESCQCRKAAIQKNHIACALWVWNFLTTIARQTQTTVYALKQRLLDDYLTAQLCSSTLSFP
ncbi:MAG: transposase [Cyanobacteria bacterium P01_E01_bin.42]